jgi:hypothetical protein
MATPKDRARDEARVARLEHMQAKFGADIIENQSKPNTHEAEYDEANKRLS